MENNLSTSTEDRKEKEAGSGGQRVKEGSESTLGCEGSAQSPVSRSGAGGAGIRQTWRGCSTQRDGPVQGTLRRCPRCSEQGGRRAEQSKNEGREGRDRARGAWGHSSKKRRGRLDLFEVLRNCSCALQKKTVSGEG